MKKSFQEAFNPVKSILSGKELKGKTIITLTDVHTGKEEVTVDENLVTNAVKDLFASNYSGIADFSKILPVKNFYSGCLLYEDPITENANQYIIKSESENHLTAHAGDQAHNTANTLRGNPNGSETVFTDSSARFVWTWDTSQGNGDIGCVCLCPGIFGNISQKPFDNSMTPYQSFNVATFASGYGSSWTRDISKLHPIKIEPSANRTVSTFVDTNGVFHEIRCLHDLATYGMIRTPLDFVEVGERHVSLGGTVDFSSSSTNFKFYETSTFYAIVVTEHFEKRLTVYQIDKTNFTVTIHAQQYLEQWFESTNDALSRFTVWYPCDDNYFYLPTRQGTQMCKVAWDLSSYSTVFTFPSRAYSYRMGAVKVSDNIWYGDCWFLNDQTFYPLAQQTTPAGYGSGSWCNATYKQMIVPTGWEQSSNSKSWVGLGTTNCFHSTINNLATARTKTSDKIMKLEYLLTEQ